MNDKKDCCFIVGGGPSLSGFNWNHLDDQYVIAINRAYEVLPKADVLYFTDQDYWEVHKDKMKQHGGKLIRGTTRLGATHDDTVQEYKLTGQRVLDLEPGCLKHGNNSTYAAINLALFHLNFSTVYLLGVDMKWNQNKSHWHSGHKRTDPEIVYNNMINCYQELSQELLKYPDKKVINLNDDSALKCFKTISPTVFFKNLCN